MSLSVLIVTHDSRATVLRAIDSARRAAGALDVEWLVIDSGSADGTPDVVERRTGIDVVRLPNRGFAAAVNAGLRLAGGDLLLLVNPDLDIAGGRLDDVRALFAADPRLGLLGCPARRPDGSWLPTRGRRPAPSRHWAEALGAGSRVPLRRFAETDTDVGPAAWVAGSFMAVRAAAAADVGPLDERFFLYREETDWCLRFWARGWEVRHAAVLDLVHASPEFADPRRAAQLARAKLQFADKHFSHGGAVSTRCALLTHHALRATLARDPARRRAERSSLRAVGGVRAARRR